MDPLDRFVKTIWEALKDDIMKALSETLSLMMSEAKSKRISKSIVNGILGIIKNVLRGTNKLTGGSLIDDAMKYYGDMIQNQLFKLISGKLSAELGESAFDISMSLTTDIYRLILNAFKKKGGSTKPLTMDRRKQRGQIVSKLMKEEGLSLGEASRKASQIMNR